MNRRHVLKAATMGVLTSAFGAHAQQRQSSPPRIGLLSPAYFPNAPSVQGLKAGLQELGFEEGRNVLYETTVSEGDPQRLRAAATALVNAKVDLIFAEFDIAARAGKDATDRIPIVFAAVISLKTAKQLRLTVPDSVLKRADRVIRE